MRYWLRYGAASKLAMRASNASSRRSSSVSIASSGLGFGLRLTRPEGFDARLELGAIRGDYLRGGRLPLVLHGIA